MTTHPDRLRELSQHSSTRVRDAVATNPSTDDATVLHLAQDPAATIRLGAALYAHDRPTVEAALAASSDVGVRQVLAHLYAQEPGRQLVAASPGSGASPRKGLRGRLRSRS